MELVYLWVENYKNIRNQGFNFSPRFVCEFKAKYDENRKLKDDCELEIKSKEYISIFPDNINVTAIVGENGSGKSNILNMIKLSEGIKIIVWHENGKKYYISDKEIQIKYISNEKTNDEVEKIDENYLENSMLLSWDFLGNSSLNNYFIENLYKREDTLSYLEKDENIFFSEIVFSLITFNHNILFLILEYYKKEHKPIFNFCPSTISFQIKNIGKLSLDKRTEEEKNIINYINSKIDNLHNINLTFADKNISYIKKNIKEYFILFLCKKFEYDIEFSDIKDIEELEDYFKNRLFLMENIIKDLNSFKLKLNIFSFDLFIFSDDYLIHEFEKLYLDKKETFEELLNLEFIELNYGNENGIKLLDLSQGERTIFLQSLLINSWICKTESDSLFLLFDEIDVSLHPNWKKKQVQELINLLSQYNKIFHLILTSHSPFILSDIPKENVIFLDKFDDKTEKKYPKLKRDNLEIGNCINVSEHIKLKTFGANIHTLLSNGFFMSDMLMGEFAKSKINEIKKFYELIQELQKRGKIKNKNLWEKSYKRRKTRFNNIQKIIGEPFLQTIIKNYLDELEQIFDNKTYKKNKMKEFLDQFEPEELQKYLDEKNAKA
ncbi:AAA family ATPase [Aliarcobacter butzleri]|uniref:AAA family ATPase n=1 Tax=Aliarcobacter butzleri TaxID=28197 RepID=UPI001EDBDFCD|nr:AAA family ATPase [Aliarcobacter butzleri]MCG3659466.1 ATP-binding protein [Aliarcobacter butzleri]